MKAKSDPSFSFTVIGLFQKLKKNYHDYDFDLTELFISSVNTCEGVSLSRSLDGRTYVTRQLLDHRDSTNGQKLLCLLTAWRLVVYCTALRGKTSMHELSLKF